MTPPPGPVLALNAGSSSLKATLYDETLAPLARVLVERVGEEGASLSLTGARDVTVTSIPHRGRRNSGARDVTVTSDRRVSAPDQAAALGAVLDVLREAGLPEAAAAGHRIVHGGARHAGPARIDEGLLAELEALARLAPLHMPGALSVIAGVTRRLPDVPQVASFDTAFFHGLPERSRRLPIPASLDAAGVRRFGFHGLSYEYVVSAVEAASTGRAVVAHLGNGASMAALLDGAPVETTMGFTPAGGIVMGTRPGDIDPGVLVHMARELGMDADDLDRVVTRESGLLGISGTTSDMRDLLAARAADPRAALAVEMFCIGARREVGGLAAVLGGLDLLVFTGGIGEHAAEVRAEVCEGLAHLGVELDAERNARAEAIVSTDGAAVTTMVVPTDEDAVVARQAAALTWS